uniref:transposase n=2 Tax=Streptomyces angustmyceticus TaxID=285578 RepID=UPI0036F413A1
MRFGTMCSSTSPTNSAVRTVCWPWTTPTSSRRARRRPVSSGSTPARPGRTENCQIGVFATYATAKGRALVDRELYLPKSWRGETDLCRAAGIPDNHGLATKGELARAIVLRALASSLPIAWVTGDCAYAQEWRMRRTLEEAGVGRRNVPGIGATEHQKSAPCPQQPPPPGRASRSPPMPAAAKSPSTSTTTLRHTPPSAPASICASSPTASASTPASTARSRLRWGPFAKIYRENGTSDDTARRVARQRLRRPERHHPGPHRLRPGPQRQAQGSADSGRVLTRGLDGPSNCRSSRDGPLTTVSRRSLKPPPGTGRF